MSEEKQMTLYGEGAATKLVNQYDHEFQSYKRDLNLVQKDRGQLSKKSFSVTKVLIGSFLAASAVSLVLMSNYLEYRVQLSNNKSEQEITTHSWVFPVYFMAGVFSVSSVLSFKKAIK